MTISFDVQESLSVPNAMFPFLPMAAVMIFSSSLNCPSVMVSLRFSTR